jgi:acyl-CoA synthetase (AMP-forming)/AMP-acid ligase II
MRIEDFLRENTKRFGDRTALVAGGQRLTFAELDDMSDRMAAALAAQAIAQGDRALVFMDNAWETAVTIFAVLKAGAILVPIDPSASADDLAYVANDSHAAVLITQSRLAAVSARAMAEAPSLRLTVIAGCQGSPGLEGIMRFEDAIGGNGPALDPPALNPPALSPMSAATGLDHAMLVYDSAAMGRPTSATATHDDVAAAATSIATRLGSTADDVILCLLPIAFDDGLYQLLTAVKVGATLVLETPDASPQTIFGLVAEESVTVLPLAPAMAAITREMMHLQPGAFPSLRRVVMATGLPPAVVARLRRILSVEDDGFPSEREAKALVAAE